MISEAKKKADAKFDKKTYDNIRLRLRKDAELNKNIVEEEAKKHGESVNAYVLKAIAERIARDSRE
nr:MAG TPA: Alginate and motility regulator [Bacteriophage sp.]